MAGKSNSGKVRLDLIPPEVIWQLGQAFTFGIRKYGDRNWEDGSVKASDLLAATDRHITKWKLGERHDPESRLSHLVHANSNLSMAIALEERGILVDDLPYSGNRSLERISPSLEELDF